MINLCGRIIRMNKTNLMMSGMWGWKLTYEQDMFNWKQVLNILHMDLIAQILFRQVTRYTRDLRGRVTGITDAMGQKETYCYRE